MSSALSRRAGTRMLSTMMRWEKSSLMVPRRTSSDMSAFEAQISRMSTFRGRSLPNGTTRPSSSTRRSCTWARAEIVSISSSRSVPPEAETSLPSRSPTAPV